MGLGFGVEKEQFVAEMGTGRASRVVVGGSRTGCSGRGYSKGFGVVRKAEMLGCRVGFGCSTAAEKMAR